MSGKSGKRSQSRSSRQLGKQPRRSSFGIRNEEGTREQKKLFVLITEGRATEPDYFQFSIRDLIDEENLVVDVQREHSGTYTKLVAYANDAEKKHGKSETEYWIIADTEDRTSSSDFKPLTDWAAEEEHHHLGLSNTMFEVWVLMHADKVDTSKATKAALSEQMKRKITKTWSASSNKHLNMLTFTTEQVRHAIRTAKNRRVTFSSGDDKTPPMTMWTTSVDLLVEQLIA